MVAPRLDIFDDPPARAFAFKPRPKAAPVGREPSKEDDDEVIQALIKELGLDSMADVQEVEHTLMESLAPICSEVEVAAIAEVVSTLEAEEQVAASEGPKRLSRNTNGVYVDNNSTAVGTIHVVGEQSVKATCKAHRRCRCWVSLVRSTAAQTTAQACTDLESWLAQAAAPSPISAEEHARASVSLREAYGMRVRRPK